MLRSYADENHCFAKLISWSFDKAAVVQLHGTKKAIKDG